MGVGVGVLEKSIPWGRGEYCDEYDQPMFDLSLPAEPVEDRLTLTLAPASLALGGRDWQGFAYAFRFQLGQ